MQRCCSPCSLRLPIVLLTSPSWAAAWGPAICIQLLSLIWRYPPAISSIVNDTIQALSQTYMLLAINLLCSLCTHTNMYHSAVRRQTLRQPK